jgi:hypothetical protein
VQGVQRFIYHLPGILFDRPFTMGPARFLPRQTAEQELRPAFDAPLPSPSHDAAQRLAAERFAEWEGDAVLEVSAEEFTQSGRVATEAVAVLRFLMRKYVSVNVETHRLGLVGDFPYGIRHVLAVSDASPPLIAPGWTRVGGTVDFRFAANALDEWDGDPVVAFLGAQLGLAPDDRSMGGQRVFNALAIYDSGLRALSPVLRLLTAAIAIEVLFSREDMGKAAQTTAIARRIAYLTCFAGCGRTAPHCPYTETAKGHKQLLDDLRQLAVKGQGWMCSAFVDIVAPDEIYGLPATPLFDARNEIAHQGRMTLDDRDQSHLLWVVDNAFRAGLEWYAAHPTGDMALLDQQIGGPVPVGEAPENHGPGREPNRGRR